MTDAEKFQRYEKVRLSGKYKMFMDAGEACVVAGLTLDEWFCVIENYGKLKEAYGEEGEAASIHNRRGAGRPYGRKQGEMD